MGAFFSQKFIFLLACIDRWEVYNRLVFACTVKTAIKVKRQCVSTSKTRHCGRASSVLTVFFVCVRRSNKANLEFKTTIIEDTHLTLIGIPSKLEANNSLVFFVITNIREKISRVSVPVYIYNSLMLQIKIF